MENRPRHTSFDDFIYQSETGEEEDELPVFRFLQADADFVGGEMSFDHRHKVDDILESMTAFAAFNYHAALVQFETYADEICQQPEAGAAKALKVIASLADSVEDSRTILRIACAVARGESGYPPTTVRRIEAIAKTLGQTPPALDKASPPPMSFEARERPVCIAVGNQKGGTGKSTTAVHLAAGLMARGYRVGCIDLGELGHQIAVGRQDHRDLALSDLEQLAG